MAEKEAIERRVYNLPVELLERLRAYAADIGVSSETEVARRLLDAALQMRDSVASINKRLRLKFAEERDLRALATHVLSNHALIKTVHYGDDNVSYLIGNGEGGRIDRRGVTFRTDDGGEYYYEDPPPATKQNLKSKPATAPTWEPSKGGDLDDDIPF